LSGANIILRTEHLLSSAAYYIAIYMAFAFIKVDN